MPSMRMSDTARRDDLAKIHIAKKQLDMADDAYRALLWTIGRVKSSAELDHAGRARLLDHLRACGWQPRAPKQKKPGSWDWVNNAAEDRKPMLRKIAVILKEADRPKEYADGMAKKMHAVDLVEFCRPDQLHDIVAALVKDQMRREART